LARVFRAAGFATDLFDATCIAECRMYSTNAEVWRGLAKNAHEGLGSPRLIGPATLLLLGGQILPTCLLLVVCFQRPGLPLVITLLILGTAAAFLPRLMAVVRFRQPLGGALLHPFGIFALLAIQWFGFVRSLCHHPAVWKAAPIPSRRKVQIAGKGPSSKRSDRLTLTNRAVASPTSCGSNE
jgi:hypothetical protein